jgi:uncharacterized protein (DUF2267 family)
MMLRRITEVEILSVKKLKREEKANLAINMTDVVIQICADGIKDQNPDITEAELKAKLRERLTYQKALSSRGSKTGQL